MFARGRPRMFMPILLSALCGLRRGEAAALKWRAIDLNAAQLSVTTTLEQTAEGAALQAAQEREVTHRRPAGHHGRGTAPAPDQAPARELGSVEAPHPHLDRLR
jgi:integrase